MRVFEGKKKLVTIPILAGLVLSLFPIIVGLGLAWLVYKKINNQKLRRVLLTIIAIITLFFGSVWIYAMVSPTPAKPEQPAKIEPTPIPTAVVDNREEAKVMSVIDGDTIEVEVNGKTDKVRFIGINTPETVDPRKTVECFGEKASKITKDALAGKTVWLESDPTQGDRDKYGRLLRYIWTDDGAVDFGKVLIATGFAYEYTYNTPYKYQSTYKESQTTAEQEKSGLWADDACPTPSTTVKKPTAVLTETPIKTTIDLKRNCKYSCSGPDRDCSDFSSHTEAQSFFNCCGFTATNDPMRLDSIGVGDGVACE